MEIFPKKVFIPPLRSQQTKVVARYADGSTRDVSRLAVYSSNAESVVTVDDVGLIRVAQHGETAVIARFEGLFAVAPVVGLAPKSDFKPIPVPTDNLVDRHVISKLNELAIAPSEIADDAEFLRRVMLDLIGLPPTPNEIRNFLADKAPNKREKVIDAIFKRPEFIDHWTLMWGDMLQNSRTFLSEGAMKAYHAWIRNAVEENRPLDEFTRQLLMGTGGPEKYPGGAFFIVSENFEQTVERSTQVFCGVRMLCAKCHHHPWENWTQADYFGLASFFSQVTTKQDPAQAKDRKAKLVELNLKAPYAKNPRTGKLQPPRFLGGEEPKLTADVDRREAYAKWLTSPSNPYFARNMANRVWSRFFHRGIIDPVDDLRATNPPCNEALLDALTTELVAQKFDVRKLMRVIVLSRTYQRSSTATRSNTDDVVNFSRSLPRRLPAESLVDALAQATAVPDNFTGYPKGTRAAQLIDTPANVSAPRKGGAGPEVSLLALLGKPQRMEACECERSDEVNMLQALEFINGRSILERVSAKGARIDLLLKDKPTDEQLTEELYLWTIGRLPTKAEWAVVAGHFKRYGDQRTEAAQDLMWTLLNSKDFLFNH